MNKPMSNLPKTIARFFSKVTFTHVALICCCLTCVLASLAIAGWLLNMPFLAALSSEYIPMAPSTAACFIFIALAISLGVSQYHEKPLRYLATALLLAGVLLCGIIFLQFAANLAIDIESALSPIAVFRGSIPLGRMSPLTSTALLLAAFAAILLTDFFKASQKVRDLASILGFAISFSGFAILLGYLYDSPFVRQSSYIPVAISTSLAFMLLGMGIVAAAGPKSLPSRWFQGESAHAKLLRSFLPILLLSMAINGAADIFAIRTIHDAGLVIAYSTIFFFILLCAVLIVISHYVSRMLDQSMKAQRESEQRFRAVFEQAAVGVAQVEVGSGRFAMLNKKYCEIVGYSQEELQALTFLKITHPDDLQTGLANTELMREGKIGEFTREKRYIHSNGSIVWVKLTVSPMWSIGEDPNYYIVIVEDITERKLADEALQESRAKASQILNSTAEGIYGLDLIGNCTFFNPSGMKMLGYHDEKDLIGRNIHELIHHTKEDGTLYPQDECPAHGTITKGNFIHRDREILWRSDETSFPAEYWAHPIFKDNELIGTVVTFIDITERVALEYQLLQSQKMEAVGTLAGGVAHNFNNILQAITGNMFLLKMQTPDDGRALAMLEETDALVMRAADMTKGLLSFSRKQLLRLKPAEMNEVIKNLAKILFKMIGKDILLNIGYSDKALPVTIDVGQIQQVLVNLVLNARDSMPHGGRISIELGMSSPEEVVSHMPDAVSGQYYCHIDVMDTGAGIESNNIKNIFDPFFTTKEMGVGTGPGMGLAIVYGIVKQHDGHITVESTVWKGTKFKIYLPLAVDSRN